MAPEDFKRKLTAVFSADVVEYSRLMGEDEDLTVRTPHFYSSMLKSRRPGYSDRYRRPSY